MIFEPKQFPGMEVEYNYFPGQKGTFHDPEFAPEIEFTAIYINGCEMETEWLEYFVEQFGSKWEKEILEGWP